MKVYTLANSLTSFAKVFFLSSGFSLVRFLRLTFFPIALFFCSESYCATVTGVAQTTALFFSDATPGASAGTIKADGCVVTGGIVAGITTSGTCLNGSFSVSSTGIGSIKVFLSGTLPSSMTGPGTAIPLSTTTAPRRISLAAAANTTSLTLTNYTSGTAIPTYSLTGSIPTNQAAGLYSNTYTFLACSCTGGSGTTCPNNATASQCVTAGRFASTTGNVSIRIVTPISIVATSALEFGSFAASTSAGTITQAGATTGGVTAISSGSTRAAGVFTVSGDSQATIPYTFTLPASVTLTGPGANMIATLSFASGTSIRSLTAGSDVVNINGSLAVDASQAAGTYTGTYNVTVVY